MRYLVHITLCFLCLSLPSCDKADPLSSDQENRLVEKIDSLNLRLDELEKDTHVITEINELIRGIDKYAAIQNRKSCILNIRNIHQAIRAHQGLNGMNVGQIIHWDNIFGKEKFIVVRPTCPLGGDYILMKKMPRVGEVAAQCPHADTLNHKPENHEGW